MRLAAIVLATALAAPALARDVSGVQVPETFDQGGRALKLNGAGLRKKFVFKVYVGALYLVAPSRDAAAVVAADEPKAVRMTFLRDVTREQMMDAFREGFRNNSPQHADRLVPQLDLLAPALSDLKKGQVLQVVYTPGLGSTVGVEGQSSVTVAGKDFADALFRNWLGSKPADDDLKASMLGG